MFYKQLPQIAKVEYQGTVHDYILQYLKEDNTEVQLLRRNFLQMREGKNEALTLICIAEEQPTEIQKLVKRKEEMKVLTIPFLFTMMTSLMPRLVYYCSSNLSSPRSA